MRWITKKAAKQVGKWISKKLIPDKDLNMPYEGDDDKDGVPNFMVPDSEYCQMNCTQPQPLQQPPLPPETKSKCE